VRLSGRRIMNELANEEMESRTDPIRQEASGCPLQTMHTQCTVLDADDELVFPMHKRVVTQYSTDASGQPNYTSTTARKNSRSTSLGYSRLPRGWPSNPASLLGLLQRGERGATGRLSRSFFNSSLRKVFCDVRRPTSPVSFPPTGPASRRSPLAAARCHAPGFNVKRSPAS
jgi:hypothetical protein